MLEGLKISALAALLLAIFALPTLTATQLVSVLGEQTDDSGLRIDRVVSDAVLLTDQDGFQVLSYTKAGHHPIFKVINESTGAKELTFKLSSALDASILSQTVDLSTNEAVFRLFDHSTLPFNNEYTISIPAWKAVELNLNVVVDQGRASYGTIKFQLKQND